MGTLCVVFCALALTISAERSSANGWSMETPDRVTAREGKATVLFCKFTHPYPGYKGNITILWKRPQVGVVFSYTNYPSLNPQSSGFVNLIHQNIGERYRVMGSPRENDASIIIKQLREEDTNSRYTCRVDFKDKRKGKVELKHGVLKIRAVENNIWPVTGKKGDSATLPCTFSAPGRYSRSITVLWMKENPCEESAVFNHSRSLAAGSHYTDSLTINQGDRYELIGNPTQGDASIRMRDLGLNDTSDYFCHVHVENERGENVTQDVMRLEVVAPATILELSVVSDNITGDTIVCKVEGEPPANITWIDPENRALPVDSSSTTVTREPDKHQTVGEILDPTLRGDYSCVAVNEHGRDVRQIHLPTDDKDMLNIAIYIGPGILIIFFLLIGFTIWRLKRDPQEPGGVPVNSVANDTVSQQAETVSLADPQELGSDAVYSVVNYSEAQQSETDPQELESDAVYSVVNYSVSQQAETEPQEAESLPVYSSVTFLRPHQAETDAQEVEGALYSNVNKPKPPQAQETAVIYATVINSTEQHQDVNEH